MVSPVEVFDEDMEQFSHWMVSDCDDCLLF